MKTQLFYILIISLCAPLTNIYGLPFPQEWMQAQQAQQEAMQAILKRQAQAQQEAMQAQQKAMQAFLAQAFAQPNFF